MKEKESAKQTLEILEKGYYTVNSNEIDISAEIKHSIDQAVLYTSDVFKYKENDIDNEIANRNYDTEITVENCTAMQAAQLFTDNMRIGCLNFASANNPGGGFLSGARAQEESLARASSLYPSQMKYFEEMYAYNRSRRTYLYSDTMIYSPNVVFFKNDKEELLTQPYVMDILTSPAVNIGAMVNNNRPDELKQAKDVMLARADKILSVFTLNKIENLILGAWGCGVFRNNPEDVASYFAHYLTGNGKYAKCFRKVVFAVFDRSKTLQNINAFKKVFN